MNTLPDSTIDRVKQWVRGSISLRILTIAFLILLLLIPVSMITSLIRERENLRQEVVAEVSDKWSKSQTLAGPILSVPYKEYYKTEEGELIERIGHAYFLPDELYVAGKVVPQVRYRSIYEVVVYTTHLEVEGYFSRPDFAAFDIDPEHILWDDATVIVGLSDLRGITEAVVLDWQGRDRSFDPGATKDLFESGITASIDLSANGPTGDSLPFSFRLDLNGSGSLHFVPLGKQTQVALTSTWADPSFDGAFLPDARTVDVDGFTADWKVLHLNRNYPQQWLGDQYRIFSSSFGVRLLVPVDAYQKSMRSAKYTILFISLTFLTFFFIEIMNSKRIHPIQYIMIGFALSIFYVLLISLSEHLNFNFAFILASLAVVLLITLFSVALFKSRRLTLLTALMLVFMYGFIYTLLQLQDYALLIGSLGLFCVLAAFMYFSRKIDWYASSDG
jgi:inner membrane protein